MKDTKEQNVLCRFCLSHSLLFIIKVQFAYQRSFVSAWQRQQQRRHWLVSDGATDGSVVVFVNAQIQCVRFWCLKRCSEVLGDLSGAVEVASLWQCDRAGLSLPVMDEHSQGEHLSFLSFLHHIISHALFSYKDAQRVALFACIPSYSGWTMAAYFPFLYLFSAEVWKCFKGTERKEKEKITLS